MKHPFKVSARKWLVVYGFLLLVSIASSVTCRLLI